MQQSSATRKSTNNSRGFRIFSNFCAWQAARPSVYVACSALFFCSKATRRESAPPAAPHHPPLDVRSPAPNSNRGREPAAARPRPRHLGGLPPTRGGQKQGSQKAACTVTGRRLSRSKSARRDMLSISATTFARHPCSTPQTLASNAAPPCCRHVCRALALASRPKCIRALPRPTAARSPTAVRRRGARAAHDEPARPRPTAGRAHSRHGPKRPRRGLSAVVAAAAVAPAPVVSAPPQTSLSSPDSSSSDTVSSSSEDDESDTGSSSSDW